MWQPFSGKALRKRLAENRLFKAARLHLLRKVAAFLKDIEVSSSELYFPPAHFSLPAQIMNTVHSQTAADRRPTSQRPSRIEQNNSASQGHQ